MATRIDILVAAAALGLPACAPETRDPATPVTSNQQEIVRGAVAAEDQLLSTVALVDSGAGEFFCTGTLVGPTVVITAAHCFIKEDQSGWIEPDDAAVGFSTLGAVPVPRARRRGIARFTVHPGFDLDGAGSDDASGVGRDDDIAVVVLDGPVDAQAPTAMLPGERLADVVAGAALTISGYGVTDLNPARDQAGRLHIGQTTLIRRSAHELLAGGGDVADTCNGDSGGPAYVEVGGRRYLAGVTSRAAHDAEAECGDRGIYTLVTPYLDWIAEVAANGPAAQEAPPALGGGGDSGDDGDWGDEEGWGDEEDRGDEGDGEPDVDVCAEEGWYGDEECDRFCDNPDPDCGEVPEGDGEQPEPAGDVEQPEPESGQPEPEGEAERPEPEDEDEHTPWGPPLEEDDDTPEEPEAPMLERERPTPVAPVDEERAQAVGCNASPGAPEAPWPALALGLLGLRSRRPRATRRPGDR